MTLGPKVDSLVARNANAFLNFSFGAGDDVVTYGPALVAASNSILNLGDGIDTVSFFFQFAKYDDHPRGR